MKSNYHLKHVSVFISAIAMLFGAAPLAQAETLTSYVSSKRSEQSASAIATNVSFKEANNQIKQSVSTRAVDLLPTNDPKVAESTVTSSNLSATSPATQYSLTPLTSTEQATEQAAVATPSNESVFADVDSSVTASDVTVDQTNYLSQVDTDDDDGLLDDDPGVLDNNNDVLNDETYEEEADDENLGQDDGLFDEDPGVFDDDNDVLNEDEPLEEDDGVFESNPEAEDTYEADPDEDVLDGEDGGLFEDEDVDDGDGDDVFEDAVESISPGRATRSGPSYIGIGGNIGLGDGETALGEGSFAAFSKIGLTRNISVRPSVLINDNPTILLPVTFDFVPGVTEVTENVSEEIGFRVSPFIGAGAAISTGDDGSVDFLATGGVDVPLGDNFTGVAAVNVSLFDDPAVGLLLGIGVNFPALR
ncbi:MAG: hypothetical protein ACTS2F_03635 [Thainema sp.]